MRCVEGYMPVVVDLGWASRDVIEGRPAYITAYKNTVESGFQVHPGS